MFRLLGLQVSRAWPLFLVFWIIAAVALQRIAPKWDEVARGGQFDNLPADSPSKKAHELFDRAFPDERASSTVVIVLCRKDGPLTAADRVFAERSIRYGLLDIAKNEGGLAAPDRSKKITLRPDAVEHPNVPKHTSIIARVRDYYDPGAGPFLTSKDQQATLVVAELTTDVVDRRAWSTIESIEKLLARLHEEEKVPEGLQVALTGSAVVGREYRQAELESVHHVEKWTVTLVIILLLVIYRSPVLALLPILTVFIAVSISVQILSILAERGLVSVSETTRMYIIVICYGAGVDYCLFLAARYREELLHGYKRPQAVAAAVQNVAGALVASAATVACGIGVLYFAKFGMYHQVGFSVPLSLVVVLASALTFAPALLRLTGPFTFWPGKLNPADAHKLSWTDRMWTKVSKVLQRWPTLSWIACVAVMVPFALVAVKIYGHWNYGMSSANLPNAISGTGTKIVEQHFDPGMTGPITVVLKNDKVDFTSKEGFEAVEELTHKLQTQMGPLELDDIRSVDLPFGIGVATKKYRETLDREAVDMPELNDVIHRQAMMHYISHSEKLEKHATRIELVLKHDPLTNRSIDDLAKISHAVKDSLPPLLHDSEVGYTGATASLRDMADVTSADLRRIEIWVPIVVFLILVALLWWPVVSLYLIISVIFSFLATLGVTHLVFHWLDPNTFNGLDWKVPIFLFAILVAVGEDYNIFLIDRVKEEIAKRGPVEGISHALVSTGGIISSCGIVMAGTFAALLSGSLIEMKQLGFALTFGVLLDTLVVRPILVPAFLFLQHRVYSLFSRAA